MDVVFWGSYRWTWWFRVPTGGRGGLALDCGRGGLGLLLEDFGGLWTWWPGTVVLNWLVLSRKQDMGSF